MLGKHNRLANNEYLETQGSILDAAIRYFAKYGYKGASLSKIAGEAGVSKSLIFWYFQNKESLFQSLIDRFVKSCKAKLAKTGPAGDARAKIEELIDIYWEFISQNLSFVRIFMNWFMQLDPSQKEKALAVHSIHNEFRQIFADFLQEGVATGLFRKNLDIPSTTLFIVSTLEGVLLQLFIHEERDLIKLEKPFFQTLKQNLMIGIVQHA